MSIIELSIPDVPIAILHPVDTLILAALTLVFAAILLWVFRPGSRRLYRDQADIPFRYDRNEGGKHE